MNIFLAGKVDPKDGAWRTAIVGSRYESALRVTVPRWYNVTYWDGLRWNRGSWDTQPKAVFGLHDYVGPFREAWGKIGEHGGESGTVQVTELNISRCGHGSGCGCDESEDEPYRLSDDCIGIRDKCISAIAKADLVFAVINSPDAYGTVAEIAIARMLGTFVAVMIHPAAPFARNDFWFAQSLAHHLVRWPFTEDFAGGDEECYTRTYHSDVTAAIYGLRDALVAYTAWQPPQRQQVASTNAVVGAERAAVAKSFQQIQQWTSDPRVRSEAAQMLARLRGE